MKQKDIEKIFENAKEQVDLEIEYNGYFDDALSTNLEDIIIDAVSEILGNNIIEDIFSGKKDYDFIINLTEQFLTYLFNTNEYDYNYYDKKYRIRKVKGEK